jgi:DNA (cytosine-5)-methyltransferase 1
LSRAFPEGEVDVNELALFAGIGGGLLGTKWLLGFHTVCYVEIDGYCIDVLKARIAEGLLDDSPIWGDIKTFDGKPWSGSVDIITAGFPCQPFSVAGKRKADRDDRNLWPETIRVIREVRPRYALLENVPGLLHGSHGYFGRVLGNLAESGYDARWRIVSAADVGAPHLRKRLWILAYDESSGLGREYEGGFQPEVERGCEEVGNTDSECLQGQRSGCESGESQSEQLSGAAGTTEGWWDGDPAERATEPRVGRLADGIPDRMERQKGIGNAQVPAVVALAWELLTGGGR